MFTIEERIVGDWVVLDVTGKVQVGGAELRLRDKVNSLVHQGYRNLLLNLGGVSVVDSTGLGALIAAKVTVARAGGQVHLINLTQRIQDLMVIAGLLSHFAVFDSEEAAMAIAAPQRLADVGSVR